MSRTRVVEEDVDFVVANEDDKNQMDSSNPTKFGYQKGPGATTIGKPMVHPATADLRGKVYNLLRHNATRFLMDDVYRNPDAFVDNGSEPASGNDCVVPSNATIQITLELVSWKIISKVTTDNKVSKNILNEGEEYDHSNDAAVVQVKEYEDLFQ
ncbi:hypothetical protein Tco_0862626 [Tanacetum coccineum]